MSHEEIPVPDSIQGLIGTAQDVQDLKQLLVLMFQSWIQHESIEAAKEAPLITLG